MDVDRMSCIRTTLDLVRFFIWRFSKLVNIYIYILLIVQIGKFSLL